MDDSYNHIGVLGAGTWGTALAIALASNGHHVTVWSALPEEIEQLLASYRHPNLPEATIPQTVSFTSDIATCCQDKDAIIVAVPSVFVRSTAQAAAPYIANDQLVITVAKGIEQATLLTMSEVVQDVLDNTGTHQDVRYVGFSGPTHAEEVSRGLPSAIVAASKDDEAVRTVQSLFMSSVLRVYTSADIKGVELCGALKNAVALACGIAYGLGYGDNTRAALITRGMEEIKRLGLAIPCDERTFDGLAGIGDLIVTATSNHSRNNRAGMFIGQGLSPAEAIEQVGMVVEGINVLPAALALAERYHVALPIIEAVDAIVHSNAIPAKVAEELMNREPKAE